MRHNKRCQYARKPLLGDDAGLTVLELMIVLVILSLIAAVGTVQVARQLDRAKTDVAALQLRQIQNALEMFYLDVRRYPNGDEGLAALVVGPSEALGWRGPYVKDAARLIDPWGNEVSYELGENSGYSLVSIGSDGKVGGDGAGADIVIEGGS